MVAPLCPELQPPDNGSSFVMVTQCICYNRTFAELRMIAEKHELKTIEQLQEEIEFGLNCRLCHPYVKRMLETGATEFEVMEPGSFGP